MTGTEWEAGDAIGIFMLPAGEGLEESLCDNVKHVHAQGGTFTVEDVQDALFYPADGSKVDFVAYYPFTGSLQGGVYPIDLTDQSDVSAIDFLYSDNARGKDSESTGSPFLHFDHVLSKLFFDIVATDEDTDLRGMRVEISGARRGGEFDLSTGELRVTGDEGKISTLVSGTRGEAEATLILLPEQGLELTVHFVFADGEESVLLLPNVDYDGGFAYGYTVSVEESAAAAVVRVGEAQIDGWELGEGDAFKIGKAEREEFYSEGFGIGDYVVERPALVDFVGWDSGVAGVSYASLGTGVAIRSKDSDAYMYLQNGADVKISGLPTDGYADVGFSCSVFATGAGDGRLTFLGGGDELWSGDVSEIGVGGMSVEFGLPTGVDEVRVSLIDAAATLGVDDIRLEGLKTKQVSVR